MLWRERTHSHDATRPLSAIGLERTIVVEGHGWTVREVIDPMSHSTALIFSSDHIVRRVRHYPPNWRDLSDGDLVGVSWSI